MAGWCLVPQKAQEFKEALKDGTIDPQKLSEMSSEERNGFLSKFVGEENSKQVNSLFESKLLLKNQKAGYINWAKRVSGIAPEVKRDLMAKIESLDTVLNPESEQSFLRDLASSRLGANVTSDEAKTIFDLSQKIKESKASLQEDGTFSNKNDRINYGVTQTILNDYVGKLKAESKKLGLGYYMKNYTAIPGKAIDALSGATKSILSSLDNSFFGRQGVKALLDTRTSHIWIKDFAKSWVDIAKELGGVDAMTPIKADIVSRPNALNGKYKAAGIDLGLNGEEAYPSSFPERLPLLGRLFKASESAYNGGAMRLRADLADRVIARADKYGVNTLNPDEARSLGKLVNSMTGRGSTNITGEQSKLINNAFFSVKFLKSNFDTLTAHMTDSKMSGYAKKEAAKNLASMVVTIAGLNILAEKLNPGSTEPDPRSNNFGKIKIAGHWTDITGGMGGLLHLGAQMIPTQHNGQWGFYSKNANTGVVNKLNSGEYGAPTALDVFDAFWQGKLSPVAGIMRDIWKGKTYSGDPTNLQNEIDNLSVPLPIQNFRNLKSDPNSSSLLASSIFDGLGFSVSTSTPQKDWTQNPTKAQSIFKSKVGEKKFNDANDQYNQTYNNWLKQTASKPEYKRLSDDQKKTANSNAKQAIQDLVFKKYGFIYKETISKTSPQVKKQLDELSPKTLSQ